MKVTSGKLKLYGLVRDKNGIPKVSNINTCPKEILDLLTEKEIKDITNGINPYNRS